MLREAAAGDARSAVACGSAGGAARSARATPLSALAGTRLKLRLRDYGACGRSPRDAGSLYVRAVGARARRAARDGWVYKVGRRAGTTGAADPSGPFGSGRLQRRRPRAVVLVRADGAAGCQRTLEVRPAPRRSAAGRAAAR